jgi:hypothetical protein
MRSAFSILSLVKRLSSDKTEGGLSEDPSLQEQIKAQNNMIPG